MRLNSNSLEHAYCNFNSLGRQPTATATDWLPQNPKRLKLPIPPAVAALLTSADHSSGGGGGGRGPEVTVDVSRIKRAGHRFR
jgi:hypothetical protein